jgi:N6-adenosine-specific RNA methylase IME4
MGRENHYPTSSTEDICACAVGAIAADDCVLFLRATATMLPQGLEVMAAWGFTYRWQLVWINEKVGLGRWFRNEHETLLVGTRGKGVALAAGKQWPSALEAPRREHSRKPDEIYDLIEGYFPGLSKLELNGRKLDPGETPRRGWEIWRAEAPLDGEAVEAAAAKAKPKATPEPKPPGDRVAPRDPGKPVDLVSRDTADRWADYPDLPDFLDRRGEKKK